MSQSGGDAFAAAIVEGHHATVAQRQLYLALALLAGYLARHGAVHLVGEPVFAGHGLQAQHLLDIAFYSLFASYRIYRILHRSMLPSHRLVDHHRLGRMSEHLSHIHVEGLHPVGLAERKVGVARRLADHIERSTLALGYLAHTVDVLLVDEQSHALLTLVGDDLLGREGLVADGQLRHVYLAATLLDKLGETVQMSGSTMVVDAHDGILVGFHQGAHQVVGTLLHLGIGALDGVQLYSAGIATGVDRRDGTASQADAIVVATDNDHLVALLRLLLQAVALLAVADAASQHDHLVVGVGSSIVALPALFLMLEGEHRTADERLAELIAEVAGTVRSLDQYLLRRLIQPLPDGQQLLPTILAPRTSHLVPRLFAPRIARHIDGRAGNGPRTRSATHTVANLTARTGSGTVEGFYGSGEVVRLGFQRDDAVDFLHAEPVGPCLVVWGELLHARSFGEGYIIFIGRENLVGMLCRRLLDHLEQTGLLLLAVDDELPAEDLVAAMLRVDLSEAEHLGVGQRPAHVLLHLLQIGYLLLTQRQAFLLVVGLEVVDVPDGLRLHVNGEHILVQPSVKALQHGVERVGR